MVLSIHFFKNLFLISESQTLKSFVSSVSDFLSQSLYEGLIEESLILRNSPIKMIVLSC